jgi:hypothetical protein
MIIMLVIRLAFVGRFSALIVWTAPLHGYGRGATGSQRHLSCVWRRARAISAERGPASFAASGRWYHVMLAHDSAAGTIEVAVDGQPVPALHAVDLSLGPGKVGLGSFDETGAFKDIRIAAAK